MTLENEDGALQEPLEKQRASEARSVETLTAPSLSFEEAPVLDASPPHAMVFNEAATSTPPWGALTEPKRQALVEAMIFGSDQALGLKDLRTMLGADRRDVLAVIAQIREDLKAEHRGLVLAEVAGGYVFRTDPELAPFLRALIKTRPPRMSRAALECLAIVAYRQPVTRAEVEAVRGVESGSILRSLLEKRLVRVLGRKDDIGRPMIYGTTKEFLALFGLKDLTALPTLRDLNALMGREQGPDPESTNQEE